VGRASRVADPLRETHHFRRFCDFRYKNGGFSFALAFASRSEANPTKSVLLELKSAIYDNAKYMILLR